jgi:uncharacterized CHY-type Zn-finger protein
MLVKGKHVLGVKVDHETRCSHYHTERDIIAIKFKCCDTYYPCHLCHEEVTGHLAVLWDPTERAEKAILCGRCGTELTIEGYMTSGSICPTCQGQFNPGCERHYHLYFK